jgi:hypothetical protein
MTAADTTIRSTNFFYCAILALLRRFDNSGLVEKGPSTIGDDMRQGLIEGPQLWYNILPESQQNPPLHGAPCVLIALAALQTVARG